MTRWSSRRVWVQVGLIGLLVLPMEAGAAGSASARAKNFSANEMFINDTGEVTSGSEEKTVQNVTLMGSGSAKTFEAYAQASTNSLGGTAFSEAAAETLDLVIPVPNGAMVIPISADVLDGSATARCTAKGKPPLLDGEFFVTNLRVAGLSVSSNPNTAISPAPGLTIVVNEEMKFSSGRTGAITLNGLHIVIADADPRTTGNQPMDVVVGSARASATCAQ